MIANCPIMKRTTDTNNRPATMLHTNDPAQTVKPEKFSTPQFVLGDEEFLTSSNVKSSIIKPCFSLSDSRLEAEFFT